MLLLIPHEASDSSVCLMVGAAPLLVEVSTFHGDFFQNKLLHLFRLHMVFVHTHK
jgi:hypothetical protein